MESEIVGGSAVASENAGFVAALFGVSGSGQIYHYCGGTFIAEDLVLTAGICSYSMGGQDKALHQTLLWTIRPADARVARRPQSLADIDSVELLEVESISLHPGFNPAPAANDIAIWKLKSPSPGPVLPLAGQKLTDKLERDLARLKAFGYGVINLPTWETSDVLMKVSVPMIDVDECRAAYYEAHGGDGQKLLPEEIVTANHICAGREGKDSCYADDGGPLTSGSGASRRLVGVSSWGWDCGMPELPWLYTRVANYRAWIAECQRTTCVLPVPFHKCFSGFADCDGDPNNGCEALTVDCGG